LSKTAVAEMTASAYWPPTRRKSCQGLRPPIVKC